MEKVDTDKVEPISSAKGRSEIIKEEKTIMEEKDLKPFVSEDEETPAEPAEGEEATPEPAETEEVA